MSMLLSICMLHFIAQLSPGPDVLLVAKSAVTDTIQQSLKIIFGISLGVVLWVTLTLLGFNVLIQQWPWIQQIIMLIGAIFLARMGYSMFKAGWISLKTPFTLDISQQKTTERHFVLKGLMTNLANPKIVIYFGSVFSLALGSSTNLSLALIFIIPTQTFLTFALLLWILSHAKIKAMYQRLSQYIDMVSGLLFLLFAVWLFIDVIAIF